MQAYNSFFKHNSSRENVIIFNKNCFLEFFSAVLGIKNLKIQKISAKKLE